MDILLRINRIRIEGEKCEMNENYDNGSFNSSTLGTAVKLQRDPN